MDYCSGLLQFILSFNENKDLCSGNPGCKIKP